MKIEKIVVKKYKKLIPFEKVDNSEEFSFIIVGRCNKVQSVWLSHYINSIGDVYP